MYQENCYYCRIPNGTWELSCDAHDLLHANVLNFLGANNAVEAGYTSPRDTAHTEVIATVGKQMRAVACAAMTDPARINLLCRNLGLAGITEIEQVSSDEVTYLFSDNYRVSITDTDRRDYLARSLAK